MADDIEVELPARDLIHVDVGEQDLLAVSDGFRENSTERLMMQLPPVLRASAGACASSLGTSSGKSLRRVN